MIFNILHVLFSFLLIYLLSIKTLIINVSRLFNLMIKFQFNK